MVHEFDNKDTSCGFIAFKNQNKFFDWLCECLRPEFREQLKDYYNREDDSELSWFALSEIERDWLEDVWSHYTEIGFTDHEVREFYTKSRNPECISFTTEVRFWDDNGNEVTNEDLIADGEWSVTSTVIEF